MAIADTTTPDGVEYHGRIWFDEFYGSADALITAGIVERHQLPGQPGRAKDSASFAPDGRAMGRGRNTEAGKPGYKRIYRSGPCFRVLVDVSAEETEQRRAAYERREEERLREREAQEQQKRIQRLREEAARAGMTPEQWVLQDIPQSESEFRDLAALARVRIRTYWTMFSSADCDRGFTFEPAVAPRIQMLLDAISKTMAEAKVIFNPAALERTNAEALREAGLLPGQNGARPRLRLVGGTSQRRAERP